MSLIYNNIETRRKEIGMKKMEFYEKIGMTHVGYRQAVDNDSLRLSTLLKIAEVLETTTEKLMAIPVEVVTENTLSEPEEKILNANDVLWQMLKSLKSQVELIEKYLNQKTEIK